MNTNDTGVPMPHTTLQDAADLLRSYGWTPGQVTAITEQTELDWIESREIAYRLADANDARAARQATIEAARLAAVATTTGGAGSSTRIAAPPKAKRPKKAAPGTGTVAMFEFVSIVIASIACIG